MQLTSIVASGERYYFCIAKSNNSLTLSPYIMQQPSKSHQTNAGAPTAASVPGAALQPVSARERNIRYIIVHCSATIQGIDFTATDIEMCHRARGFSKIGYHWVVRLDGTVEQGRPEDETGAHCRGYNATSIGVCYIGGLDKQSQPADTRTLAQKTALVRLLRRLRGRYPQAKIVGHNEFAAKACPCFNARREYQNI